MSLIFLCPWEQNEKKSLSLNSDLTMLLQPVAACAALPACTSILGGGLGVISPASGQDVSVTIKH
jgi:hypothetical protein